MRGYLPFFTQLHDCVATFAYIIIALTFLRHLLEQERQKNLRKIYRTKKKNRKKNIRKINDMNLNKNHMKIRCIVDADQSERT
jgi:hypothetical protein